MTYLQAQVGLAARGGHHKSVRHDEEGSGHGNAQEGPHCSSFWWRGGLWLSVLVVGVGKEGRQ